MENWDIEEPERFAGPPEPACPCGCASVWPAPYSGERGNEVKDLTLFKIDTELEQLLEYRQARAEDPVEPAAPEELAALEMRFSATWPH